MIDPLIVHGVDHDHDIVPVHERGHHHGGAHGHGHGHGHGPRPKTAVIPDFPAPRGYDQVGSSSAKRASFSSCGYSHQVKRVATRAIETARLVLEPLNPAHAALLFDALQDPRIYRWISLLPPTTMDALEARWASLTRPDDSASDNLAWAVKRHADGVYVGKCDAEVSEAGVATNVGYLIFPAFWNEGYATELLSALVADLAQQSITELHAFVTLGNQASERVLAKAGFCKVRVIRDNDTIRGSPHDDIEYVLGATRNSTD